MVAAADRRLHRRDAGHELPPDLCQIRASSNWRSIDLMTCLEAAFMQGLFRIEVQPHADGPGPAAFVATLSLVEPETRTLRPLVFESGNRAAIYGSTEPLAVNSALAYLSETFGAFAENAHGCVPPDLPIGEPFVVGQEPS
jgi:hypothetical protein